MTGENKSKIDRIWDAFWTGGISDSLRVIEQMSYLLFIKRLDDIHTAKEKKANRLGKPIEEPIFGPDQDHLRWSRFRESIIFNKSKSPNSSRATRSQNCSLPPHHRFQVFRPLTSSGKIWKAWNARSAWS